MAQRPILNPAHHVVTGNSIYYYAEHMLGCSRLSPPPAARSAMTPTSIPSAASTNSPTLAHRITNSPARNAMPKPETTTRRPLLLLRLRPLPLRRLVRRSRSRPLRQPHQSPNPKPLRLGQRQPRNFADLDGHQNASPDDPKQGACADSSTTACGQQKQKQAAQSSAAQGQAKEQSNAPQAGTSQSGGQTAGGNRTPSSGEPNTTDRVPGPRPGSYGERTYGPDGRAVVDLDHGHDHKGSGDPHAHDWVDGTRQAPRNLTPEESTRADTHRMSAWVSDHKGAILATTATIIAAGAIAAAPFTGGASLGVLAFAP